VLTPTRPLGFTLIELLVGMTIAGVLLALGVPALSTYLQNSKLTNAANVYYGAVQTARTEAIRRNVPVQFVLTSASGTGSAMATAAADPAGLNWVVRAASGASFETVETKGDAEGSAGVTISASGPAGFDGTIAFNGFGAPVPPASYTIDIKNPAAGNCAAASGPSGPMRCRRIVVSPAGRVSACDPAASAASGDTRAC
jgi:type IV fimbrial biogenesis protein FimT